MAGEEAHPGSIRGVYPRRLREARKHHGWTQQQLADEMKRIGFPVNRATIAKIERGRRPIEVSELVAFATALDVAPASLFLIPGATTEVQLTDNVTVDAEKAVSWVYGGGSIDPSNERTYLLESPVFTKSGAGAAGLVGAGEVQHQEGERDAS